MGYVEWGGRRLEAPSPLEIPRIDDAALGHLGSSIKPLVRGDDGELYHIQPVDYRNTAFLRSPQITGRAEELHEVAAIPTLHRWSASSFFRPTVAQVLAQIPSELVDQVEAFEVVGPETSRTQLDVVSAGYHLAATILYSSRPQTS